MKMTSNRNEEKLKINLDMDWLNQYEENKEYSEEHSEQNSVSEMISLKMDQIYLENMKRRFLIKEISNYIK